MRLRGILPTAIAIASGILVLVGYFITLDIYDVVKMALIDWAVILAGFAVFVGIFNLLAVHTSKISQKQKGWPYSIILIVSLVTTFALGMLLGPQNSLYTTFFFKGIQLPVEASLMALLTVTLIYASIRLLRRRLNILSVVFVIFAFLILIGTAPLPFIGSIPVVSDTLRPLIAQVLAAGGARGILLGVALGTLATGLRILFGADRPYGGK